MEGIETVSVLLAMVLALTLLIERFLETMKSVYNLLDSRFDWNEYWTDRTERLRVRLEKKLRVFEYVEPASAAKLLARFRAALVPSTGQHSGAVPILAGDLVRAVYVKTAMKVVGVGVGILLAFLADINLLTMWIEAGGPQEAGESLGWAPNVPDGVGIAMSGVAMGLGTGPVHKIIASIEKRRKDASGEGGQQ